MPIVQNVTKDMVHKISMESYTTQDFLGDINRITNGRSDPTMAFTLVNESNATVKWLAKNGIKFHLTA